MLFFSPLFSGLAVSTESEGHHPYPYPLALAFARFAPWLKCTCTSFKFLRKNLLTSQNLTKLWFCTSNLPHITAFCCPHVLSVVKNFEDLIVSIRKRAAERKRATNLIGLLLAYFVVVFFTYTITLIWSLTKGEGEVWRKICSNITNITDVKLGLPSV